MTPDDATSPVSFWTAARWLAFLGPFFFVVYGFCNWFTSRRSGVGSFYWDWERSIPFVPLMIFPYMSLDLFYAGSPFLCRTRAELRVLARRMIFAILLAGFCFLLFPLRFAFTRPETTGLPGILFAWLQLDQPFNQAPSLHIALRSIVWTPYGRRVTGPLRPALIVWFFLIGFSTLLTWQHHAIDVITGEILTVVTFYFVPAPGVAAPLRLRAPFHRKQTFVYAAASVFFAVPALLVSPVFWWAAASLALVAAAYAGCGPAIFQKTGGRLSLPAVLLLGPYLAAARLYHSIHYRLGPAAAEVVPGIFVGRRLGESGAARLVASGVTSVLDLTAEYSAPPSFRRVSYLNLPVLDLTVPEPEQVREAVGFIRRQAPDGPVYIHCGLGYSRGAGVAAAYLLAEKLAASPEAAVARVRAVRPRIVIGPGWISRLEETM